MFTNFGVWVIGWAVLLFVLVWFCVGITPWGLVIWIKVRNTVMKRYPELGHEVPRFTFNYSPDHWQLKFLSNSVVAFYSQEYSRYDWRQCEKHPQYTLYKVIGLSKSYMLEHCVYLIGTDNHTDMPYSLRCPPSYLFEPIESCRLWCMQVPEGAKIIEA